jgi:hypothetical protein
MAMKAGWLISISKEWQGDENWRQVSRIAARGSIEPKMSAASATIKLTVERGVLRLNARDRWSFNGGRLAP